MIPRLQVWMLLMFLAVAPVRVLAVDASLDVPESVLNVVIGKIGALSNSGVTQTYHAVDIGSKFTECVQAGVLACPTGPIGIPGVGDGGIPIVICRKLGGGIAILPDKLVSWQWWVQNARFEVGSGNMTFTASVTTHVDEAWKTETRTVGAKARFDSSDNRLKIEIDAFTIPLGAVGSVDVAKLYRLAVPITPQQIVVPMPDGSTKNVSGRVSSATVQYNPDKLTVNFDAAF